MALIENVSILVTSEGQLVITALDGGEMIEFRGTYRIKNDLPGSKDICLDGIVFERQGWCQSGDIS